MMTFVLNHLLTRYVRPTPSAFMGGVAGLLDIERSLSGPAVKGRIHAVHMQHTTHNHSYFRGLHQFALEYIADASERKRTAR